MLEHSWEVHLKENYRFDCQSLLKYYFDGRVLVLLTVFAKFLKKSI